MKWLARLGSLLAAGVVAASVASMVVATPASAETVHGSCLSGDYCVYKDANFGGGLLGFPGNIWTYTVYNYANCSSACGLNDSVSSVFNNGIGSGSVISYQDFGYGGRPLWTIFIGQSFSYVGDENNDQETSHHWN